MAAEKERRTEYYVVVRKVGEEEGREVGALLGHKVLCVPCEFVGKGLELLLPQSLA